MAAQIASTTTTTTTTTTTINDGEIMSTTRTTLEQSLPPFYFNNPIPLGAMASAFNSRAGSIREGSIREGPIITELADDEEIDPSIPVMSSRQNSNTTDFSTAGAGAGGRRGTSYSNNIPNILSGMKRNASVSSQAAGLGGMADSGAAAASAGFYTPVSDSWNNSDLVKSGTLDNNGSTSSTLMSGLGWGKGSKVPAVANVRSLDGSRSMSRPTTLPPQAQANSRSRSNVSAVRDIHGSATSAVPPTATAATATTAITAAAAAVAGKPSKPPQFDEDAAASGGCGCFGFLFGGKKKAKKP
ncbi:hypothetical protein BDR26DRAFT_857352 [Obelidium mucronatum]|nr:hypothetical protein BDR26DRAFT_857352 [Obelidium mucronatum]